ncbi:MAG: phage Gp37/Gp68 family protein [Fervidobacterium sp.]|uniref:DUF5131 family protein n=1 Tax=Fervidobacterium sp. TaxID=1871331 RepID=UPI0025C71843|nr:phage Gp37/Gp68 family protein [Fervidobacterium sp.]NPU89999.1 phage Gp37/Gp68 family protein [Fervidobacterium sp.]
MAKTKIEWTEYSWNPITGCTRVSIGCRNCYAEKIAYRLQAMGHKHYVNGFDVALHEDTLDYPRKLKRPRMIFVNSMSDLFHEKIPFEFIRRVFDVIGQTRQHVYQILTKRPARLVELAPYIAWHSNVWVGVTVEHNDYVWRIDYLRQVPAALRFISFEPLLSAIPNLDLDGIGWVIVGAETGFGCRPMLPEWAIGIKNQCVEAGVPFFFKKFANGNRLLNGQKWEQIPKIGESKI